MKKTASEILKEKLIDLKTESTPNKTFSQSSFESEAEKVRKTFTEENEEQANENIQPRRSLKL